MRRCHSVRRRSGGRIGRRRGVDVEDEVSPVEVGVPGEVADARFQIGSGFDQEFHRRAAVVAAVVEGVEEGRVAVEAFHSDVRAGVHVAAGF